MHQGGRGGAGGEYHPSTPYYYPPHQPPPPPASSTSYASAPPYSSPPDYDGFSSSSPSSYNYYPPPLSVSDPTPPDPHLHYNPPTTTNSYYPPYPPITTTTTTPPYDPPNYPPSSLNYPPHSYIPHDFIPTTNNPISLYPPLPAPIYDPPYVDPSLTRGFDFNNYKDDGVYAYQPKHHPDGPPPTSSSSSSKSTSATRSALFDDYGRPISFPAKDNSKTTPPLKVVRAAPKPHDNSDLQGGLQKFRVKLLPESASQSTIDVLCMVGLDGIRMLDPNTTRTLRIYPLHTVTRCDKMDSSTFAFWSKTSVDIDPRRIRLQSNSYTTNTILDTVTAATVQFKEMGGRVRSSEAPKSPEVTSEKKKGLGDWITKLKPMNEEKDHWVPDEAVSKCTGCGSDFGAFNRRHHCRNCGDVFCDKCTQGRTPLTSEENAQPVRVCDRCMAEVTHRLSKAKEAASRPVTFQSHEDLAKKLQEEMEKNLRISSGTKSESSGKRMREVACPTCTVHLQVQVPSSGSETIECGVCQQPFIVSAH